MSDKEAWQRIQGEDRRVALITRLAEDESETFGGAWYDGKSDTQHLQATTVEAVDQFAELAVEKGIKAEVHKVDYSYERLNAEAEQARAGDHLVLGDAAMGDATVDVQANRVVAGLKTSDLNAARANTLAVPDTVEIEQRSNTDPDGNPIVEEVCESRVNCSKPLRSGVGVNNVRGDLLCSLGFTAHSDRYPKRKFAITAAHCGEPGARFKHHNWTIGHHERQTYYPASGIDVAAIRVENPHWLDTSLGWIYNPKHKNEPHKVTGRLKSESSIQAGQIVCLGARHSGAKGNCGTIQGFDGRGFVLVEGHDACGGDSGGGWHRVTDNGRIAYGIHHGGPDGCHGSEGGNHDFFTSLPWTESSLDVTVHTR